MHKCYHCAQNLSLTAKFCSNCGKCVQTADVFTNIPKKLAVSSGNISINKLSVASTFDSHSKHFSESSSHKLSARGMDAILHTLFLVPRSFLDDMHDILISLGINDPKILHESEEASLITRSQNFLRTSTEGAIRFVCIVGSWEEIPPLQVHNDILDDGDTHCLTDSFYGVTYGYDPADPFTAIPEIPVGRIPVAERGIVYRVISNEPEIAAYFNAFKFGVTAECWKEATANIVSSFPNLNRGKFTEVLPDGLDELPKSAVVSSPEWTETSLRQVLSSGPNDPFGLMLFNVHGSSDEPHWVGEGDGEYVRIFEPDTVENFNSALLVSEACYGGAMSYDEPSIVEQFFKNGGHSFVGSSTIAYGACSTPISGADLIAMHYVKCLYAGMSQGEALKLAKMEALADDPLSREVGLKTALSFNLFGAPWQFLVRLASSPVQTPSFASGIRRPTGSVLDKVRAGMAATPSQDAGGAIIKIRERYLGRLPAANRQFILDSVQSLAKLHEFSDFAKISEEVTAWGGLLEDSQLDFVTAGNAEGYRLFCRSKSGIMSQRLLILSINKNGRLIKTVTSKGVV